VPGEASDAPEAVLRLHQERVTRAAERSWFIALEAEDREAGRWLQLGGATD
jgi:hypothetical protein